MTSAVTAAAIMTAIAIADWRKKFNPKTGGTTSNNCHNPIAQTNDKQRPVPEPIAAVVGGNGDFGENAGDRIAKSESREKLPPHLILAVVLPFELYLPQSQPEIAR